MAVLSYLGNNALALLALLVSLATGGVQVGTAYRNRRRTQVELYPGESMVGEVRTSWIRVVISNVGGPIGISDLDVEWVGDQPPREGYSLSSYDPMTSTNAGAGIGDVLGVRRTLQDGESWTWFGVLSTTSYDWASRGRRVQVRVRLTSGKVLTSDWRYIMPAYNGPGEPPPAW